MKKGTKKSDNRSALIREYIDANPSATPSEISKALAEKGLVVSASLVSQVIKRHLGGGTKKRVPGKRGRKPGKKPVVRPTTNGLDIEGIKAAVEFAKTAGSLENAVNLLTLVKELEKVITK